MSEQLRVNIASLRAALALAEAEFLEPIRIYGDPASTQQVRRRVRASRARRIKEARGQLRRAQHELALLESMTDGN